MIGISSTLGRLEPAPFWKWTSAALFAAFGFALVVILLGAWLSQTLLLAVTAMLIGGFVFAVVASNEVALLCATLVGFVSLLRYEVGFQPEEVVYGMFYMGYLAYWFVSRLFFYRDNILRSKVDWALFLFLIYITASLALTPLLGGEMSEAISQYLSLTTIAFYFPIKEVCIRKRDEIPQKPILLSLGLLALFIAARNVWDYRIGLSQADYLWQIASGRVVMNEHVLMMAGLVTLVFLLYARTFITKNLFTGLFLIYCVGILISQSRAVWVSFLLGVIVIFFFVDSKKKIHLVLLGVISLSIVAAVGALLFEDFFTLIIAGIADRFFSLKSAAAEDVSLINRFIEMQAVWESIRVNPVIGHGFGVEFKYYSLVFEYTRESSYVHNGYVGVLYRHGLIGFVLLMTFYFGSLWKSLSVVLSSPRRRLNGLIALAALACLAAEALVGNSANPFATSENPFIIAAVAGLAAAAQFDESGEPVEG